MSDDRKVEYDPQTVESKVRKYWDSNDISKKVREERKEGPNYYIVHPPELLKSDLDLKSTFSNILLDVWTGYQSMKGHNIRAVHGYDSCTLKVEREVLGEEKKVNDLEEDEEEEFFTSCEEVERRWGKNIQKRFKKLGVWYEDGEVYRTTDDDYINSLWWTVGQLFEEDMIKERTRMLPWCKKCQVGLSTREIEEGVRTKYNFVLKFPVKKGKDRFILVQMAELYKLISTSTLAFHPDQSFSVIKYEQNGRVEKSIISQEKIEEVMGTLGIEEYEEINVVPGEKLDGMVYLHPLFDHISHQEKEGKITSSKNVPKEGTGILPISPGLEADKYGVIDDLDLEIYSPLNHKGGFTEQVYDDHKDITPTKLNYEILQDLKDENFLLGRWEGDVIVDECSICRTEIIYREAEEWFLDLSETDKDDEVLDEVEWIPSKSTPEDLESLLKKANEFPITRRKGWGIPFPLWRCDCGEIKIFEETQEFIQETNTSEDENIRPDTVENKDIKCPECGEMMKWESKILAPLLVSSASPWAQLGYPKKKTPYKEWWPGKIITGSLSSEPGLLEGNLSLNLGLFEEPSVETLVVRGRVEGEMDFSWVNNIMGYDSLRVELLKRSPPWEDRELPLTAMKKKNEFLRILWNTYQFYKEQKSRSGLDIDDADVYSLEEEFSVEERWLLSRIQTLKKEVDHSIDGFYFNKAIAELEDFVLEDLAQWYIGMSRERLSKDDEERGSLATLTTLQHTLVELSKLIAPIAPHISDEIFTDVQDDKESVHQADWPMKDDDLLDPILEEDKNIVKEWVDKILEGKNAEGLPIKWPLKRIIIDTEDEHVLEMSKNFQEPIKNIARVKEIDFVEPGEDWEEMEVVVEPNYDAIGKTYQQWTSKIALLLSKRDPEEVMKGIEEGDYRVGIEGNMIDITEDMVSITRNPPEEFSIIDVNGGSIYLDFEVTDDIWDEQIAHEVELRLKSMRQHFDLNEEDEVEIYINAPEAIFEAVDRYRETIEDELGSREIHTFEGELQDVDYILEWEINQELVEIGMVPLYKTEVIGIYESIPGMSQRLAEELYENGFTSLEVVEEASAGDISSLDGFKRSLARRIKQEVTKKLTAQQKEEEIEEKKEMERKKAEERKEEEKKEFMSTLQDVYEMEPGVSEELYENGFTSFEDIAEANIEDLAEVSYIDITRAEEMMKVAEDELKKLEKEEVAKEPGELTEEEIVQKQREAMAEEMEEEEYRSAIERSGEKLKERDEQKEVKVTSEEDKVEEVEAEKKKIEKLSKDEFLSKLQQVSHVGPARAEEIYDSGYTNYEDIVDANMEDLADISHINIPRAEELKNVAKVELEKTMESEEKEDEKESPEGLREEEIVAKQKEAMAEEMGEEELRAAEKGEIEEQEEVEEQEEKSEEGEDILDSINKSSTYLLIGKDKENAFNIFKSLMEKGRPGFCVTREFPDKTRKKYGLSEVEMVWLSNVGKGNAIGPKELDKLSLKVEDFLSTGGGVIMLMGLEYLITNNDFKTVLHLIQSLKDQVAIQEAILLLPISENAIEKQKLDMFESEIDEVITS